MSETLRLFIAVELTARLRDALGAAQARLAGEVPYDVVRWVRPESVHLTLKFLGDTPASKRPAIESALAEAARHRSFRLEAMGLGCFPNCRRPRVVWVGLEGHLDALHALRDTVEAAIAPLGYPTEKRPFHPHLTLGRVRKRARKSEVAALGSWLESMEIANLGELPVSSVSLMRSQLRPKGAVYTQLAQVKLEGNP